MINVTELRPGNYFIEDGNIYKVLDILLNKTAMRKMVASVKVKNMRTGSVTEISRNSGYAIENIRLDKKAMQYLYDTGDFLVFMDQETYDQIVEITSYDGEVLDVNLPAKVALKIVECEPAVRGDTVNKATKEAKLETGITVRVPLFISEGETVLVRTDTGEYDSRA